MSAKAGDTVRCSYRALLADQTEFDSGELELILGEHKLLPLVEEALADMKPGEEKSIEVPAADGYGEYRPELVAVVGRDRLPDNGKCIGVGTILLVSALNVSSVQGLARAKPTCIQRILRW